MLTRERIRNSGALELLRELGYPVEPVDVDPDEWRRGGVPLPWNGDWKDPWLPFARDVDSVATQRADPGSFLSYCRDLIARRRQNPELLAGAYETLFARDGVWAFRRGERTRVAVNLTDEPAEFEGGRLDAWEGVIVDA